MANARLQARAAFGASACKLLLGGGLSDSAPRAIGWKRTFEDLPFDLNHDGLILILHADYHGLGRSIRCIASKVRCVWGRIDRLSRAHDFRSYSIDLECLHALDYVGDFMTVWMQMQRQPKPRLPCGSENQNLLAGQVIQIRLQYLLCNVLRRLRVYELDGNGADRYSPEKESAKCNSLLHGIPPFLSIRDEMSPFKNTLRPTFP